MDKLQGKRIFVVEDNLANLAVFATALQKQGAIVIQDNWNLQTAELLTRSLPIDLILMDIMLKGGITGYDIFDALQSNPQLKNIPVVAVSSLDAEQEIPKARAKGFAGFIGKPISLMKFPDYLAACIQGEKVWVASW